MEKIMKDSSLQVNNTKWVSKIIIKYNYGVCSKALQIFLLIIGLLVFNANAHDISTCSDFEPRYSSSFFSECSAPPPPPTFTIVSTDPNCMVHNGQMVVTITGGVPPFNWQLIDGNGGIIQSGGPLNVVIPFAFTIFGLVPDRYTLKMTDASGLSSIQGYLMYDKTSFPYVPVNTDRAYGIDVRTNSQGWVYATGIFSGFITFNNIFNANSNLNVYLVKFDPCGNVVWDLVIGQTTGSCTINSISVDYSQNSEWVTICGKYWGTIMFPGGALLTNPTIWSRGFIARFDRNGIFIWAAMLEGHGDVTSKAITSDDNGHITIMGDFNNMATNVYNANGLIVNTLLNLGIPPSKDNYYVIFDQNGLVLQSDNILLSTALDDEAGGVDCYFDATSNTTEVFFTGKTNGNEFLGQRFTLNTLPFTFSQTNIYFHPNFPVGIYTEYFGKGVGWFKDFSGARSIHFAVKTTNIIGGSFPMLFFDLLPPTLPQIVTLANAKSYINNFATEQNAPTSLAVRHSTGELYMGGFTTEPGFYPVGGTAFVNGSNDIFMAKSWIQPTPTFWVTNFWDPPFNSDPSHNAFYNFGITPEFFGICADEKVLFSGYGAGKAYITGAYQNQLVTTSQWPGIAFPFAPNGGEACYIARVVDSYTTFGPAFIRNAEVENFNPQDKNWDLEIYPNPVNEKVNLYIKGFPDGQVSIMLLGIDGRQVSISSSVNFINEFANFDISALDSGIYVLSLNTGYKVNNCKLIKM